jgi:hypothetical protein
MDSIAAKLAEYETLLKLQMQKIEELAAENELLRSGLDAHSTLKEIYLDRNAPQGNRIKAAQAALNVEKPRLAMTAYVGKDQTAEVVIPLADLVRRRRARVAALQGLPPGHPRYLEWVDRDGEDFTDSAGNSSGNGNGQDDDTAG